MNYDTDTTKENYLRAHTLDRDATDKVLCSICLFWPSWVLIEGAPKLW